MEEEYTSFESEIPFEEQEKVVDDDHYYIFEDAITGSLQIVKKVGNIEPVILSFNKFINVQEFVSFLKTMELDKKIEYPQFYIVKTKTPYTYIS